MATGITKLTPEIVQSHELSVTFQQIAWDKSSSIPYLKQNIIDSEKTNHITRDKPTFPGSRPR